MTLLFSCPSRIRKNRSPLPPLPFNPFDRSLQNTYKKHGVRPPPTLPPLSISPIFRAHFQVPHPATPLVVTLYEKNGGVGTFFPFWDMTTLGTADVGSLSPVFSHSCALFCTQQALNSLVFNRFRTLCNKTPGVGARLLSSHPTSQSTRHLAAIPLPLPSP